MITSKALRGLVTFAAVQATFDAVHPFADQWVQTCHDATTKGKQNNDGRVAAARHAATYTATQTLAVTAITRALGARIRPSALAAGAAITGVTHYAIDRREGLKRVLRLLGKTPYLTHATVQRREGVVDEGGPGTALMEYDQAAHRIIGVATSAVVAWLATRDRS